MGLFANPLSYAGYPASPVTAQVVNNTVRAATLTEANAGAETNTYISPATMQAAVLVDFASPPVLGFGSTTPRPVHATTLDSTGVTSLATAATTPTLNLANAVNTVALAVNIANGASAALSVVNILSGVGTVSTAELHMADNPRVNTITLANVAPAAARTTTVLGGNSAQNDTLTILGGAPSANTQAMTVFGGAATGGTQTVGFFTGNVTGATQSFSVLTGTGAGTLNLGTGITGAKTVHIADGAAANTVTVGSTNTTSTTTIQAGSGKVQLTPATVTSSGATVDAITTVGGSVKVPATAVSGATPVVNNVRTGQVGFSDNVQAGMYTTLTMTNSIITSASVIVCSASCATVNSAPVVVGYVAGSGTVAFRVFNGGAADTNGGGNSVLINFWILN